MIDIERLAIQAATSGARAYLGVDLQKRAITLTVIRGQFTIEKQVKTGPSGKVEGWEQIKEALYGALFDLDRRDFERITGGREV